MEATTFSARCRDSGEWARRAQSSAYCSSKMCWVVVLVKPNVEEVAIQSVLYLYPIRRVQEFVGEEGDCGEEYVEDGWG